MFDLEDDGVTSTVKTIEHAVEFTSTVDGSSQLVNAGEMLSSTANGLGEKTTFDVKAEQAAWNRFMKEAGLKTDKGGFPLWLLIVILGVAAVLLAAAVALFVRRNKAKRPYLPPPIAAGPTPVQPLASGWYYSKSGDPGGQQVGPLTWAQLFSLAQAGMLTPYDAVWNPALPQWLPAAQVRGLFPAIVPPGV